MASSFASAGDVILDALSAFLPPDRVGVDAWAAEHRWLANEGGGHVGLWDHRIAPYLVEPMQALGSAAYTTVAIVGPGQSGKALALDTPIATPAGWSTMGELAVGDAVFADDGQVCHVTFATPVQHGRPCYSVRFSDGAELVADEDHQWVVHFPGINFTDPERCEVRTTGSMAQDASTLRMIGNRQTVRNRYSVCLAGPLMLPDANLPVDPYLLGLWLGDGHSYSSGITLHEDDAAVFEHVRAAGYHAEVMQRTDTGVLTVAIRTRLKHGPTCTRGHVYADTGRRAWGQCSECNRQDSRFHAYGTPRDAPRPDDSFTRRLFLLGIFPNAKAIPPTYQRASVEQRMALLQGLLDTDGSADHAGRVEYSTVSPSLASGFAELASGLGLKYSHVVRKVHAVVDGDRHPGRDSHRFAAPVPAGFKAFRLARKQSRLDAAERPRATQTTRRKIVAIEPVASVPVRCIQVNSPSHLFLAGRAMVPTHNTEVANNWMLTSIDTDPAGFLRFMQTDDAVRSYVKSKIDPMIEAHDRIKSKQGLRPIDDSIGFKRFRGMTVEFLAAARSNLISKSAPRIVADEIDAYDQSLGDVKTLLDVRRQTFGRDSMLCMISHPDRALGLDPSQWTAGIMAVYADSQRCTWWWRCPHCSAYSSPVPGTARHMALHYPLDAPLERVASETRLVCPSNGCLVEDHERRAMNRTGRWIGRGETIAEDGTIEGERLTNDTAGYWIVGAMSPFLLEGIGGLARNRVKAERAMDAGEDEKSLAEVLTKQWGIPIERRRKIGSLDAVTLADRAEPGLQLGIVPEGVRFITAVADSQANRFEGLVRGWGVGGESWVLAHWSMVADTALSPADWDTMIARLMAPLPLADGSGRFMRVHAAGFDSGGADGVTLQAYGAWQRAKKTGVARMRGKVDGRDAWSLLPLKGMSGPNAARMAVVYPDSQRTDRFAAARGQIPLGQFNPNTFKDDLAIQLGRADAGSWAVHTPTGLRGDHMAVGGRRDEPPHTFFEQLVAETRSPKGQWTKTSAGARNEALDLMVMSHAMAHLHGLARLRWDAPRAWHAPWDSNSGVTALDAPAVSASAGIAPMAGALDVAPVPAGPIQLGGGSGVIVSTNAGPRTRASRMA